MSRWSLWGAERGWTDVGLWVAVCFLAKISSHRLTCKTTFERLTQSQAISQSFRVFISFRSRRDTTFLQNLDLDVIGIAETWLLPGERVQVDGYRWIGIPREGNVGRGGVGLFVKDGYEVEVIETGVEEEGGDEGMEAMWVRLRRKGLGYILIGVMHVTPQGLSRGMFIKADQFVEFICDKSQQGEEMLVMGDFNAHFDSGGKALDCRTEFLNRLNKVGGLRIMKFADFTRGKWKWQGREKQSV